MIAAKHTDKLYQLEQVNTQGPRLKVARWQPQRPTSTAGHTKALGQLEMQINKIAICIGLP